MTKATADPIVLSVLAARPLVQASMREGAVDDPLEWEAEAVAERVLRMPDPAPALAAGSIESGRSEVVYRCPGGCPPEGRDDHVLHRQTADSPSMNAGPVEAYRGPVQVTVATEATIGSRRGRGQPLAQQTRSFFESRFGARLGLVRVHTDTAAAALTRSLRARAFTVGTDLFFGAGEYQPQTSAGKRLLAHELVHTLQQGSMPISSHPAGDQAAALGVVEPHAFHHHLTHGSPPFAPQRSVLRQVAVEPERTYSENCGRHLGDCEFYRCRQANTGHTHSRDAYYIGYGLKYCERFRDRTRGRLSPAGREWAEKARVCLQEHIHRYLPYDADPDTVKQSAFNSHPGCYVRSGVCFLTPDDWSVIWNSIDRSDNDLMQVLATAVYCAGNYLPMAFPVHSLAAGGGYRGLMDRDRRRLMRGARPFPPPEPVREEPR
jgi:hypothetical protein